MMDIVVVSEFEQILKECSISDTREEKDIIANIGYFEYVQKRACDGLNETEKYDNMMTNSKS